LFEPYLDIDFFGRATIDNDSEALAENARPNPSMSPRTKSNPSHYIVHKTPTDRVTDRLNVQFKEEVIFPSLLAK